MSVYNIDLHIHTPASSCYGGRNENEYQRIIQQIEKNKFDVTGITDHHSFDGILQVRELVKGKSMKILPGTELTCRIGDVDEVFLLAMFTEDCSNEKLNKFLNEIKVPVSARGHGSFVIKLSVDKIKNIVESYDGVTISARADKNEFRRKAIPEIVGTGIKLFDLVYPESKLLYNEVSANPADNRFFTFSDAHSVNGIGERYSRIEADSLTDLSQKCFGKNLFV